MKMKNSKQQKINKVSTRKHLKIMKKIYKKINKKNIYEKKQIVKIKNSKDKKINKRHKKTLRK